MSPCSAGHRDASPGSSPTSTRSTWSRSGPWPASSAATWWSSVGVGCSDAAFRFWWRASPSSSWWLWAWERRQAPGRGGLSRHARSGGLGPPSCGASCPLRFSSRPCIGSGAGRTGYVTLVRDPAWELDPAPREVVDSVLHGAGVRTSDRPLVAVSLKPGAGAEADRLCRLAVAGGLIRWAQGRECDVLFMCFSDKGDYQLGADLTDSDLGRQLQEQMDNGPRVRFIGPDLHPSVMLGVIERCSAVVAMRLHARDIRQFRRPSGVRTLIRTEV